MIAVLPTTETLQQIIDRTDARIIAAELLGQGKRSGHSVRYPAVWAGGDNPTRIAVYEHGFHDFRDDSGGNVVQLISLILNLTYAQAADWLRQHRATGDHFFPQPSPLSAMPAIHGEPPSADWQHVASAAVEAAERYLWSDVPDAQRARAYLHQVRGLNDETIRRFRLGYNPGWRKLAYQTSEGQPIRLPPGIVIPYFDGGALWAVRVRCRVGNLAEALSIQPDCQRDGAELAKYLNLSGSKVNGPIFNGDDLRESVEALIVEGEFDAMLAQQQLGDSVTVVTLGPASSRLTRRGRERLEAAGRLYAALDNDEAGHQAVARLLRALPTPLPTPLPIPSGKDITEFMVEQNGDLLGWWTARIVHSSTIATPKFSAPRFTFDPAARFFASGVPDSWRSAALDVRAAAALVLELATEAIRAGLLNAETFTYADLQRYNLALGWSVSDSTLRRGLESGVGVFFSKLETDKESKESVSKIENNSGAGRRAEIYRLNSLGEARRALLELAAPGLYQRAYPAKDDPDRNITAVPAPISARMMTALGFDSTEAEQIAAELNAHRSPAYAQAADALRAAGKRAQRLYRRLEMALEALTSTPLPAGWTPHDLPTYRAAFLRGWLLADPDRLQCSRAQIRHLIGISNGSVDSYRERAGITVTSAPEGEFERRLLGDAPNLEHEITRQGYEVKGRPMEVIACAADGSEIVRPYNRETVQGFAAQQRRAGVPVFVNYQVANRHMVDPNATPESAVPARRRAAPNPSQPAERRVSPPSGANDNRSGYRLGWVKAQLELGLRLMGWVTETGRFMNPNTGEIAPQDASVVDLISLMLCRPVAVTEFAPIFDTASRVFV